MKKKKEFTYHSIDDSDNHRDVRTYECDSIKEVIELFDLYVYAIMPAIYVAIPHYTDDSMDLLPRNTVMITPHREDIRSFLLKDKRIKHGISIFECDSWEEALGYVGDLTDGTPWRYNREHRRGFAKEDYEKSMKAILEKARVYP